MGKKGIRINAVAPGLIETDMTRAFRGLGGEALDNRIAMRRAGRAEEVASAIVFALSDEASYINGAVLPVDGGFA